MILWMVVLVYLLAALEGSKWLLWLIAAGYVLYLFTGFGAKE